MQYFRIISIFILFLSHLYALDDNNQTTDIETKKLYLSCEAYPKRVFTNQRFSITLKAIILYDQTKFNKIITTFIDQENIDIITQEPKFILQKDNTYKAKIIFKANKKSFILPTITVALFNDDEIVDYLSIKPPHIDFEQIAIDQKLFSNIIASSLEILQVTTKQYNNNNTLVTIALEAKNSNLEDIHFLSYKEQGIDSYTDKENIQRIYYYKDYQTKYH